MRRLAVLVAIGFGLALAFPAAAWAGPEYEQAYVNGTTVTINAIELHQSEGALTHAAADFYQVVYPTDHSLWPAAPQCKFNPLWHVFLIVPSSLDPATQAAYAAHLPLRSEADVDALVDSGLAVQIDLHFYFLCAVVNGHAAA